VYSPGVDSSASPSIASRLVTDEGESVGPIALIAIKDQGVDSRKDLERIFERFYRVDPSIARDRRHRTRLSIVRHVAQNHAVTSSWSLVRAKVRRSLSSFRWRTDAKKHSNDKRVNILLVEDEESFVDALTIGLDAKVSTWPSRATSTGGRPLRQRDL